MVKCQFHDELRKHRVITHETRQGIESQSVETNMIFGRLGSNPIFRFEKLQ